MQRSFKFRPKQSNIKSNLEAKLMLTKKIRRRVNEGIQMLINAVKIDILNPALDITKTVQNQVETQIKAYKKMSLKLSPNIYEIGKLFTQNART